MWCTLQGFWERGGAPDGQMFEVVADLCVRTGEFRRAMQVPGGYHPLISVYSVPQPSVIAWRTGSLVCRALAPQTGTRTSSLVNLAPGM